MNDHPDYPLNPNWVRVNSSTSITLDVLPAIKTTPQTLFTVINTVDLNTHLTARSLTFRLALNYCRWHQNVRSEIRNLASRADERWILVADIIIGLEAYVRKKIVAGKKLHGLKRV